MFEADRFVFGLRALFAITPLLRACPMLWNGAMLPKGARRQECE